MSVDNSEVENKDTDLAFLFADRQPVDHFEQFAKTFNLTKPQLQMLTRRMITSDLYTVLELLKAKNHKSTFRASLAMQVRKWLDVNAAVPIEQIKTVPMPLSIRQMQMATPKWPVHYNIPSST